MVAVWLCQQDFQCLAHGTPTGSSLYPLGVTARNEELSNALSLKKTVCMIMLMRFPSPACLNMKTMLKHVGLITQSSTFLSTFGMRFHSKMCIARRSQSKIMCVCVCVQLWGKRVCQCCCSLVIILEAVQTTSKIPTFTAILVASMMKSLA